MRAKPSSGQPCSTRKKATPSTRRRWATAGRGGARRGGRGGAAGSPDIFPPPAAGRGGAGGAEGAGLRVALIFSRPLRLGGEGPEGAGLWAALIFSRPLQLGEDHEKTKESSEYLKCLTQQAVALQRTMNEIYRNGSSANIPPLKVGPRAGLGGPLPGLPAPSQ